MFPVIHLNSVPFEVDFLLFPGLLAPIWNKNKTKKMLCHVKGNDHEMIL